MGSPFKATPWTGAGRKRGEGICGRPGTALAGRHWIILAGGGDGALSNTVRRAERATGPRPQPSGIPPSYRIFVSLALAKWGRSGSARQVLRVDQGTVLTPPRIRSERGSGSRQRLVPHRLYGHELPMVRWKIDKVFRGT